MARGAKATLEVQCWKEHTCCYCGTVYRYLLKRRQTGYGATERAAHHVATAAVVHTLGNTVELRPCPQCGHYQPDMIGSKRLRWHLGLFIAATVLFALIVLPAAVDMLPAFLAVYLLFALGGIFLLLYAIIGLINPNARLKANLAHARRLVDRKVMQVPPVERDEDSPPRPVEDRAGCTYWLAFLLVGAALLFLLSPEAMRLLSGWPSNPDWSPSVIGPGDSAWAWMPTAIHSVRGHWKATGTARIVKVDGKAIDPKEIGLKDDVVKVSSHDLDWGKQLRATAGEEKTDAYPWLRVQLPNNRELAHKRIDVEVVLNVSFPVMELEKKGDGPQARTETRKLEHTFAIDVASPHAGFLYTFTWYLAVLSAFAVISLAGAFYLFRDRALSRMALPTRVIPVDEESGEPTPLRK